jgi:methyl-accepting chemotaxis protein
VKRYRRKRVNLAIKSRLQARMLGRLGLLLLICVAAGAAMFYAWGSHELGQSLRAAHFRVRYVEQLLLPALALAAALALILGLAASLFFPLYVIGPLPRLESALRRIGAGDLTGRLALRKGDVLKETGEALNEMTAGLSARLRYLKVEAEALRYEADRLQRLGDDKPELRELIGPISSMSRQLSRDLDIFRTAE